MQGANFTATVNKANTELQNVLNTGSESDPPPGLSWPAGYWAGRPGRQTRHAIQDRRRQKGATSQMAERSSTEPAALAAGRRRSQGQRGPGITTGPRSRTFVRRHKLAPYLLLAPALAGIALVLLWPLVQVVIFSFQNYGLMQITGAAAHAVGGPRELHQHLQRPGVLARRCAPRCSSRSSSCRRR